MIIEFDDAYIKGLASNYSIFGKSQLLENRRYYLAGIIIDSTPFYLCIPLHSNSKYFISLSTPSVSTHWKNHGLNLEKMLILKKEDLCIYASASSVQNNIWNEIVLKKNQIEIEVKNYIVEYLRLKRKRINKELLSRVEENMLNFSSLNHFQTYIDELLITFDPKMSFLFLDIDLKTLI